MKLLHSVEQAVAAEMRYDQLRTKLEQLREKTG